MDSKTLADHLEALTQSQRERLAYIEVKANFCGDLTRADIERRFGVRPAASSRDLATYRKLAPDNLAYEPSLRRHVPTDKFKPVFPISPQRILTWLREGIGDVPDMGIRLPVPCESASELVNPDLTTLAILTRAIAAKRLCKVDYLSLSSGRSSRTLAPVALANTGLRFEPFAFSPLNKEKRTYAFNFLAVAYF